MFIKGRAEFSTWCNKRIATLWSHKNIEVSSYFDVDFECTRRQVRTNKFNFGRHRHIFPIAGRGQLQMIINPGNKISCKYQSIKMYGKTIIGDSYARLEHRNTKMPGKPFNDQQ